MTLKKEKKGARMKKGKGKCPDGYMLLKKPKCKGKGGKGSKGRKGKKKQGCCSKLK